MRSRRKLMIAGAALLAALASASCSSELTNNSAPVELVVTNTQNLSQIDLFGGSRCGENVGTINVRVLPKNDAATGTFTQVRITRYSVSYQRTDGGTLVPAPFVRSTDALIDVGGTGSNLSDFLVVQGDALLQAPFAALLPNNGGRDPETGRPVVTMDVIVQVFGQTLGGENVYDATRFPLDFCYDCGGCS